MSHMNVRHGPPVMIENDALTPEQLSTLQNSMNGRFRSQLPSQPSPQGRAPSFQGRTPSSNQGASGPSSRQGPGINQAPRAHQQLPGIVDCDYYPGSFLDVVG